MDMMSGDGWGWMEGGVMMLMMLIFWGGLIAVVIFAVRGSLGSSRASPGAATRTTPDANEILSQRFARGEISEEEFEQRRLVLERRAS